jgi:hypothetical protein
MFLTGGYPLWRVWRANRRTSLAHAVYWMLACWLAWGAVSLGRAWTGPTYSHGLARNVALCLTGCAGVAVLGARRPGVAAWNFVVLGLLGIVLLPVAEGLVVAREPFGFFRELFLAATIGVGIANYLPTRLALGAFALAVGCACQFVLLSDGTQQWHALDVDVATQAAIALAPLLGFLGWCTRSRASSPFDEMWLDFRDRFGVLWASRVRDQFNRAAVNAALPVQLRWRGLQITTGAAQAEPEIQRAAVAILRGLLMRFANPT